MPAIAFRIARASAFTLLLVFTNLTAAGIDRSHATQVAAAANRTSPRLINRARSMSASRCFPRP